MLKIRLMKPGKSVKGSCHYKIVVMEIGSPRDARFIEQIGYYDPSHKLLEISVDKYDSWIKKGAKATETAASLFKRYQKQNKRNEI